MKLKVNGKKLASIAGPLARIADPRSTIPIVSHLLLETDGHRLIATANNLEMTLRGEAEADVIDAGRITLPAGQCATFAKLAGAAEVTIEIDLEKKKAKLSTGRSRVTLPTLPAEDFPMMERAEASTTFSVVGTTIVEMIRCLLHAVSTEVARHYLNGIYLHAPDIAGGRQALRGVATDGHQLAQFDVELPAGAEKMPGIILPRAALSHITNMLSPFEDQAVQIVASQRFATFSVSNWSLTTKLIDGSFPDYQRVIPDAESAKTKAVIGMADLASALSIDDIIKSRGSGMKFDFNGRLLVSARDGERGSGDQEADAEIDGPRIEVGFQSKYVKAALDAMPEQTKSIHWGLIDPGSPARITPANCENPLFVIMPCRV